MDQRTAMLRGGDYGAPTIVPGHPEASFLLKVLRGEEPDLKMPPKGPPLDADQIALLEKWIADGAVWPGQMDSGADELESDHWSLRPVANVRPPTEQTSESHPIDAFIVRSLRAKGLELSAPADPITLVRRAYFVLTGLPPSPEQVDAVVHHPDGLEHAYQQLVDCLLDSPRYGERWAQHWLDVIRWAETVGFETNLERPNAWPYRDWVIRSFNEDKPYHRFLLEQIAGDTVGQDAALGFLVAGPANLPGQIGRDEKSMREARQDELDEVIRTVGQAFFGMTIGCARCHNHKFDPILQRDYYSMQAIFAGLSYGERRWRGEQNDKWAAQMPAARDKLAALREQLEAFRIQHRLRQPVGDLVTESFEPVAVRAVRMEIAATASGGSASLYELEAWTTATAGQPSFNVALESKGCVPSASSFALANQTRHYDNLIDGTADRRQAFPWTSASQGPAWVQIDLKSPATIDRVVWDRGESVPVDYKIQVLPADSDDWRTVADTSSRMLREDDTRRADQIQLAGVPPDAVGQMVATIGETRTTQRRLERLSAGPQVYAASFTDSPDATWLLRRGDAMQRVEPLPPAVPLVLGNLGLRMDEPEQRRRLALANHLTKPDHPLTARVIVNRVWQQHFGTGLVKTPSDFGKMGSVPSHPELLDWLAADFIQGGWSLKRLHRQILLSKTFQQSSQPVQGALAIDAESRLLWRFPPRRLEAEAIRDSILAVSGKLDLQMGGPGFDLFNQRGGLSDYVAKETFDAAGWRRMIYAHKIRMQAVDVFGAFDCPDAGQMSPTRTRSVTSLQALSLLNSPFVLRQAAFFAERIEKEAGGEVPQQIDRAFRLAYSRLPGTAQRERMAAFVHQHGLDQLCRTLINTGEFLFIQ